MIGYYGDIIFESSDKRLLTFSDLNRTTESRWAAHEVIMRKPAQEFLGPGLDTVTFSINLNGRLGVKPRHEMEKWLIKSRAGTADFFFVGGKGLGVNKWIVKNVSQMWGTVLNKGEVLSGKVDVTLEEYVEYLK